MKLAVYNIKGENLGREVELPEAIFGLDFEQMREEGGNPEHVLYLAVKQYLGNQRQGTHKTKQRNEIAGSTRKLHRQKGTGGSRKGSIKNPLYHGGGRIFGPQPRSYETKLNRKTKALARRIALSSLAQQNQITVIEDFTFDAPKTRNYRTMLESLNVGDNKNLLLLNPPATPAAPKAPRKPSKPRGAKQRANYATAIKDYVLAIRQYREDKKAYEAAKEGHEEIFRQKFGNIALSCRNLPNARIARPDDLNAYQIMNAKRLIVSEGSLQRISELWG
jgi:large subunit ribosomal protein L4